MPQSGIEAPANDKYGTVAEWRRSRLIDRRSLLTPHPCKAKTRGHTAQVLMCAVGVVPTRVGAYLRVSGP